jgi:hypothetical protein
MEVDHIKDLVNSIHTIKNISNMYNDMLEKISITNSNLNEEHRVNTEQIVKYSSHYNLLLKNKKKQLKSALRSLASSCDIVV